MKTTDSPPCSQPGSVFRCFGGLIAMGIALLLCACGGGDDEVDANSDAGSADAGSSAPSPELQAIQIERAAKVGDRYRLEGEGHSRQVMEVSLGGKPMPERSESQEFSAVLVADVEVLAINANNKASKVTVLVKSLTRADDGAAPVTLLENTVVDAANEAGGVIYSITGIAVEEKIQQAIKLFTVLNSGARKVDEDTIFGTDESHAPGAEWPVNKAAIAEFFAQDTGMELVPDSIQGSMKFDKVDTIGGVACQVLSGRVSMDMAGFPGVPEEAELSDSTVEVSLNGAFPVDPLLPVAEKTMSMKMTPNVAYTTNGITVEMKMSIEQTVTSRKTPRQ